MDLKNELLNIKKRKYCGKEVVLFGAGNNAFNAIKLLEKRRNTILCLFDNDKNKWGNKISKYTIYPPDEIKNRTNKNTLFFISSGSFQYEISKQLINNYGIKEENIFSFLSEYYENNVYLRDKIIENVDNIEKVIDLLEDSESKNYFKDSILLRYSQNPLYSKKNPKMKNPYEYHNKVILKEGFSIVDCGAFVGDTSEYFLEKLHNNCNLYCIEPFSDSYNILIKNEKLKNKAKFYNCAISDEETFKYMYLFENNIPVSAILSNNKNNKNKVRVKKLDNILKNEKRIDFIKMDIEGMEPKALLGAKKIIKTFKPNMMISAYHRVEHLWIIPFIVKTLEPNYKIYAGHQVNAPIEIEFYFTVL
jgi:FkbM family methyltransferase